MLDTIKRKIGVKLVSKSKKSQFQKRNKILQTIDFKGFAKKISNN